MSSPVDDFNPKLISLRARNLTLCRIKTKYYSIFKAHLVLSVNPSIKLKCNHQNKIIKTKTKTLIASKNQYVKTKNLLTDFGIKAIQHQHEPSM